MTPGPTVPDDARGFRRAKVDDLRFRLPEGMGETLRLTRDGRLAEATERLKGMLRGGGAPEGPMPGLAETLRDLGRRAAGTTAAPDPAPPGARVETGRHDTAWGAREFRLYVPANRGPGPAPLIVMLHGCTQSPEDFAAGTRMEALAETAGCLVLWPGQAQGANAQRCWNWFEPDHQRPDRGEPAILADMIRRIGTTEGADPARIHVAGLSAGGAAAMGMAAAFPDLFASVGVHSGLPAGAAHDLPSALGAMRRGATGGRTGPLPPTIVFHGDRDTTVHPANGEAVVAQVTGGVPGMVETAVHGRAEGGGHGFVRTIHADRAGRVRCEHWLVHGAGHAWAGGSAAGSHTDPRGPDASAEMLRFFGEHPRPGR